MALTDYDLVQIIEKASTLEERFSGAYMATGNGLRLANRRFARWKALCAENGVEPLAALPRGEHAVPWQESDALGLLGDVRWKGGARPHWVALLAQLSAELMREISLPNPPNELRRNKGIAARLPFAEILSAISRFAWQRVCESVDKAVVNKAARVGLEACLWQRLSEVVSLPLHELFTIYRPPTDTQTGFIASTTSQPSSAATSTRRYQAFVVEQRSKGLRGLFTCYPAAARLVAQVTIFWIDLAVEFFVRLAKDRLTLSSDFFSHRPLGEIADLQAGISDPHYGGRTAIIVRFSEGLGVVYKPRSLEVDRIFSQLLEAINAAGFTDILHKPRVLERQEYGWIEYIPHLPVENQRAAHRFYRRAGALTCLAHWLDGTDFHRENFIACGEHPVLVDLEALAHPRMGDAMGIQKPPSTSFPLDSSVIQTGLLPCWKLRPDGKTLFDNSALGAPIRQPALMSKIVWRNLQTDRIVWHALKRPHQHRQHRTFLHGRALSSRSYKGQVLRGFRQMAHLLADNENAVFGDLRRRIRKAPRRMIKRATLVYAALLRRSLRPEFLLEGVDRSLELQMLPPVAQDAMERAQEIRSLESLDIPYHHSRTTLATGQDGLSSSIKDQAKIIYASLNRDLILLGGWVTFLHKWRQSSQPPQ